VATFYSVSTHKIIRYHNSEDLSVIRLCICMQMRTDVLMFHSISSEPVVLALYGSECCTVVKTHERRTGVFTFNTKNSRRDRFLN
jgi:hypothetical protein